MFLSMETASRRRQAVVKEVEQRVELDSDLFQRDSWYRLKNWDWCPKRETTRNIRMTSLGERMTSNAGVAGRLST